MAFKNDIKKDYLATKESLMGSFPEAFEFLNLIESLSDKGFHVGTHKNLHLYFNDKFLFYFKRVSFGIIAFSSKPNGIIKDQTFNHADNFFTPLQQRLLEFEFDSSEDIEMKTWVINKVVHYEITLTHSPNSKQIFRAVIETLEQIS